MSNKKLEELRDIKAEELENKQDPHGIGNRGACYAHGFRIGWDEAMKLNLPVLFAKWLRHYCVVSSDEGIMVHNQIGIIMNEQEAYDYWLEHIYKPQ